MTNENIAAIATPLSVGGIAIIRISGPLAIEIADRVFAAKNGDKLVDKKGYTASFGTVAGLDNSIATVFRAPKSYTGENVVEISCHGGIYLAREVLRKVIENGARLATAGEFTKRAFLNGKLSLTQAEAVSDMIYSQNKQALNAASAELEGALSKKIMAVKNDLLSIAGSLAAWVDYPDEDIPEVSTESLCDSLEKANIVLENLLKTYDTGMLIKEGIDTVIVGKPNVGKSTLMNLLSGYQKSIVTDIPGTTRDVIEEKVQLGEVMLRLSDTAGIRQTQDIIEQFGVDIAKKRLDRAVLVIAVFDSSTRISQEDKEIVEKLKDKLCIALINKMDLPTLIDFDYIKEHFENIIYMSAKNDSEALMLEEMITKELNLNNVDFSSGMVANERQRQCITVANKNIIESVEAVKSGVTLDAITVSIETAIEAMLELTGERITNEIVNQVFSHFCVGK